MASDYDCIVIGTGQSGPAFATRMAASGKRVAIIERGLVGGTCVNTGCTPTKTLVASARAAYVARRAAEFGVLLDGDVRIDMQRVKARKDAVVRQSNEGVTNWLESTDGVELIRGHARFTGPDRVRVGERTLRAPCIVMNVGARALVPPMPGVEDIDYFTSTSIMDVDFLPTHLVIIGGSYIGLEFAQVYRRFGSKVTVVERGSRLIAREDEDVSATVREILETEGVNVVLGAECTSFEQRAEGIAVGASGAGETTTVIGSHVLLAIGRRPNTDDLGLDAAGVETDERGYVRVDDGLATNVPGVYAIGDVNGHGAFTHTSYDDYEVLAANLIDGESRGIDHRITTYGLFIDPPLGRAGMTESQAREAGKNALVGKLPMSRVGRARERGETQGFMKVLVDADTDRILGAAVLGIGGDEVVHSVLEIMYADAPYTTMKRAVHIHPTVTELLPTLLGDLTPLD